MSSCDPCAADPLSPEELRRLGVFWVDAPPAGARESRLSIPSGPRPQNVFITRLHVRYDAAHFPEDLVFQETADRTNFQGRYVLRHAWSGTDTCEAATRYRAELPQRREREAQNLALLTGWSVSDIRRTMNIRNPPTAKPALTWWQQIWRD